MTSTTLAEAIDSASLGDPRRHVVTGGPSSGKDNLIEAIRAAGIPCMEAEPGREIYRKHRERLGRHLRREDRHEYSLEVLQAFIGEFTSHKHGIRFYNRGIPDGYGWDRFFGLGPTPQLEEASRLYRYDTVFVLDPLDTVLLSPNSVLANALLCSIDLLRPRVRAMRPARSTTTSMP